MCYLRFLYSMAGFWGLCIWIFSFYSHLVWVLVFLTHYQNTGEERSLSFPKSLPVSMKTRKVSVLIMTIVPQMSRLSSWLGNVSVWIKALDSAAMEFCCSDLDYALQKQESSFFFSLLFIHVSFLLTFYTPLVSSLIFLTLFLPRRSCTHATPNSLSSLTSLLPPQTSEQCISLAVYIH